MKPLIPFAALSATVLVAAPAPAQTGGIAQVQAHLRALDTMTATFVQTGRDGKALGGTLTLKRPGRIRFQYQKGVPILVVGDGRALNYIDYSVRQVTRWPIANSPLGVLLDPGKDISRFAHVVPGGAANSLAIQGYDPKHPEYGKITIVFARNAAAPAGLTMQGWVMLDSQGNQTTIRLSNQRFNQPVSDGTFRWNDPRTKGGRN